MSSVAHLILLTHCISHHSPDENLLTPCHRPSPSESHRRHRQWCPGVHLTIGIQLTIGVQLTIGLWLRTKEIWVWMGSEREVPGERYQVPGGCKRYLWWSSSRSPGRDAVNASFTWATIVCPGSKTHLNNYILWNTLLHLYFCITSVSASDPIMSVHSFPEDFIHYLGFRRSGVTCRDTKVNQL